MVDQQLAKKELYREVNNYIDLTCKNHTDLLYQGFGAVSYAFQCKIIDERDKTKLNCLLLNCMREVLAYESG